LLVRRAVAAVLPAVFLVASSFSQTSPSEAPAGAPAGQQGPDPGNTNSPASPTDPGGIQRKALPATPQPQGTEGQQSKRILGIIPNYRAVSADVQLPPLSFKAKFVLAAQDSFDYSSLLVAGLMAGPAQAKNSYPEFHQGGAGFGRYYWHSFADQAVGNYFTEFIVPSMTREDPRYYTRFHGNIFNRAGYSVSRLFITRTDSGGRSFNFSEIVGNGAGAGVSDLYYPSRERTWTKTGQKWVSQVALDGFFNILKEFWPDIRHYVLRK
jgi:hypothetical protein